MNSPDFAFSRLGRGAQLVVMVATVITTSAPAPARADGYSSAEQARAQCEKSGQAGTPKELKKCCGDLILVADGKLQKKLEAQCAAPRTASKPAKAGSAS